MNQYLHGFAQSIIFLNILLFPTVHATEQIIVMSHTRKDLPIKIETTNVPNQGYVWQFEISPNQATQQTQVNLLNPNPKVSILNHRALELAKKITFDQLPRVGNDFQNKVLNHDEQTIAKTKYYYGKYILLIKFPETIQYAIKPNFSQLQSVLEPFCHQNLEEEANKINFDEHGNIPINAKFLVDTQGKILKIQYSPILYSKIATILEPLLKRISFYPHNEFGVVKAFSIEQPIIIQCH